MPNNRLLAKEEVATYSGMLLDAALEQGGAERVLEVREQLDFVLRTYRGNADLREALGNPAYSPEQRHTLAVNVFDGIDPLAVSVIAVMAERGDLDKLSSTVNAYRNAAGEKLVGVTTCLSMRGSSQILLMRAGVGCRRARRPLDEVITECVPTRRGKAWQRLSSTNGKPSILASISVEASSWKKVAMRIIMSTNGKRIDASVASELEHARIVLKEENDGGEC